MKQKLTEEQKRERKLVNLLKRYRSARCKTSEFRFKAEQIEGQIRKTVEYGMNEIIKLLNKYFQVDGFDIVGWHITDWNFEKRPEIWIEFEFGCIGCSRKLSKETISHKDMYQMLVLSEFKQGEIISHPVKALVDDFERRYGIILRSGLLGR